MPDAAPAHSAGTVNLPGIGKVKKTYAFAGAAVLMIVIVVWYRQRQAAQAAAAANTAATNATASDVSATNIDPATGYPYGSAEDQAALEAQASYTGGTGYPYGGGGGGGGGSGGGTQGFTTNGQWAQAAEQYILDSGSGTSADAIAAALGKYIAGSPVSSDQQTIIQEAIAFEGYPPVNGTNGYPPSINTTGGPGGGGSVRVPNVVGMDVNQAEITLKAAGLTYNPNIAKDKKGFIRRVTASEPKAGTSVTKGSHVGLTWKYEKG